MTLTSPLAFLPRPPGQRPARGSRRSPRGPRRGELRGRGPGAWPR